MSTKRRSPSSPPAGPSTGYGNYDNTPRPDPRYRQTASPAPTASYAPAASYAYQGYTQAHAQPAPGYNYGIPIPAAAPAPAPRPAAVSDETAKARADVATLVDWTRSADKDLVQILRNQRVARDQIAASEKLEAERRQLRKKVAEAERIASAARTKADTLEQQLDLTRADNARQRELATKKYVEVKAEVAAMDKSKTALQLRLLKDKHEMQDRYKAQVKKLEDDLAAERRRASKYKARAASRLKQLNKMKEQSEAGTSSASDDEENEFTGDQDDDRDADYKQPAVPAKRRAFQCSVCGVFGHRSNNKRCPGWVEGLDSMQRKKKYQEMKAVAVAADSGIATN